MEAVLPLRDDSLKQHDNQEVIFRGVGGMKPARGDARHISVISSVNHS